MNILVTGANGFVGKNLVETLKTIKDGRNKTRNIVIDNIYEYDIDTNEAVLNEACKQADFVFHLAGVNRPVNQEEFMEGNFGFTSILLNKLKENNNKCGIMLSSSIQASLEGRFANSEYGKSKLAGEELLFNYGLENDSKVYIYRFPNLFGKWCRPNYNSVVATFCHNIAHDLDIQINDPSVELSLVYIDDLVDEMLNILENKEHRVGNYCTVNKVHQVTLKQIADLLYLFKKQPSTLLMPELRHDSFEKKLYSTYLSYLPKEKTIFDLKMNVDARGSFTELMRTMNCGQFSVNVSKPGITKGEHWHHTKWEFFFVVSGHGLIQQRKIGSDEILEFEVSGNHIQGIHMLPGYTHNIINLSDTENLVTVMWANELFDSSHPDTFFEKVMKNV